MKLLKDILYKTGIVEVIGSTNISVSTVNFDSRKVGSDSLFVATRGMQVDGHLFIDKAIDSGAIAIVCEEFPKKFRPQIVYVKVKIFMLLLFGKCYPGA